jgi:hypothetical protein
MLDLKDVTIVSVACVRVESTLKAIKHSMSGINFYDAKLITSQSFNDKDVKYVSIPELDYENYNKFIVFDLFKHIDTPYALIVQDDGYVINPNSWRDEFYQYDYIGAPWMVPNDDFSCRDPFGNLIRVGNGGFSFRSHKLLSMPTELNMEWKSYFGYYNEDGFFSVHNRHIFEQYGCKYSPLEVAKYFSHEAELPEMQGIIPFGFHGKWSKYNQNY